MMELNWSDGSQLKLANGHSYQSFYLTSLP